MSLSSLLTQKDQVHCPCCYWKVKHQGGLASHIWQSLACQAKCDNDNPQLPRTSHDPVLTPNHHDTPPGTGQHDPDGSDWNLGLSPSQIHQGHAAQCQEVCHDGLELEWDHGKFWAVRDYHCWTLLGKPDSTECGLPSHPDA